MYEGKPPSSAGRKGWSFDAIFGRSAEEGAPVPAPAVSGQSYSVEPPATDLFMRIGGFLRAHRLDPSPTNYDLAYHYLGGHDPALIASVEEAIARDGILRPEIAEGLAEAAMNKVSSELLEKLIDQAHQSVSLAAALVGQSRTDANAYGSALDKGQAALQAGGEPAGRALELMVELTRTMIGKTQDAERRLSEMGGRMETLQGELAEAQAVAETDPLTGLANRRAFQSRLARAMAQALKEGTPLSVAFCDIDFFKKINDNHGHDTGDRILKMVAEALVEGLGEDAYVGRFGGEEFLVLFDGIMARRAAMRVDEVRDELSGRHLVSKTTGEPLGTVTFSAGIAQLSDGEEEGEMLKRADEALYAAKNGGRNRVLIHGED
ncbi:GGDEF domain-containing protein [Rhizorhabdus dicambivorans]|uniref:diguanylate cyclase n=1 Tax=Rhizorhabdus dicambivorans TaxID=1850238 RepID=A0A2A4FX60_9SPHN|nr:GGDEF domain-containing protein [Rhizorhabdus dicambivorans]ATE65334.1 GGDEF domain-containing protein [Rhizorhabdus dicambivorans]PCE42337.1 GGDEF domain-containing protein [Rhizorhabdus dicambivorans]